MFLYYVQIYLTSFIQFLKGKGRIKICLYNYEKREKKCSSPLKTFFIIHGKTNHNPKEDAIYLSVLPPQSSPALLL